MLLNDADPNRDNLRVDHVRLDCISRLDDGHELWWVALAFSDETTYPQGMFSDKADASHFADDLARRESVVVVETSFVAR